MKKTIYIILMACIFYSVKAQHTLEFNQVLLLTANSSASGIGNATYNVPSNRVWKIESGTLANTISTSNADFGRVNINGVDNYLGQTVANGEAVVTPNSSFPMWLPAGTTLVMYPYTTSYYATLYVLEFIVD